MSYSTTGKVRSIPSTSYSTQLLSDDFTFDTPGELDNTKLEWPSLKNKKILKNSGTTDSEFFPQDNSSINPDAIIHIQKSVSDFFDGEIVPSERVVLQALEVVVRGYTPKIGDIHSLYYTRDPTKRDDATVLVSRAISFIIRNITDRDAETKRFKQLDRWHTVLPEQIGLRKHSGIKLRNNGIQTGMTINFRW
jgi:hypothetical protein